MKNRTIYIFTIIVYCLFCFYSCTTTYTHLDSNKSVDSLLIGEWYYIDTLNSSYSLPLLSFKGFQINNDHSRKLLGIETNTGRVKIIEKERTDTIISAGDGLMSIINYSGSIIGESTLNYFISGNKLTLWGESYSITYTKTNLNAQLLTPIISNVSVKVDSVLMNNIKVSDRPRSYIRQINQSDIIFAATFPSSYIEIVINNFNGIGVYTIPFQKASYSIWEEDLVWGCHSDTTVADIFVVDQYDQINNTCSGRFSFNAYGSFRNRNIICEIRDGIFSVPIIR